MSRQLLAVLCCAVFLAGCGADGIDGVHFVEPVTLEREYIDGRGEGREVSADVFINAVYRSEREVPVTLPRGARPVFADVAVINNGGDPFPLEWAVFTARTRKGRTVAEKLRLGPRRMSDREQVVSVGFAVLEGDDLTQVLMRSIVEIWPFRETLHLPDEE